MIKTKYGEFTEKVASYISLAEKHSKLHNVPVPVILNTIRVESAGNIQAWNPSNGENSRGLMQISERTALSYPVSLGVMQLPQLFEADFNIHHGTKYLAYIRDQLTPYFDKKISEKEKWMAITSSYNQGWGYYKTALDTLSQKNETQGWNEIKYYVLNPINSNRTPWKENVEMYGPKVMGPVPVSYLKTGISLMGAAALAGAGYVIFKALKDYEGDKTFSMATNPHKSISFSDFEKRAEKRHSKLLSSNERESKCILYYGIIIEYFKNKGKGKIFIPSIDKEYTFYKNKVHGNLTEKLSKGKAVSIEMDGNKIYKVKESLSIPVV